jgi:hypothetical protein
MGSSSGGGSGVQAAVLPASLAEHASSIASMPHVPVLPLDEGNAAENRAACGGSSSSRRGRDKLGVMYGQSGAQQQQQRESDKGSQRTGMRNSTRISAHGSSSVVLTRNKSQGSCNAKNRRGTAGATAAAVAAAAVARPKLVPAITAMMGDSGSSDAGTGEFSSDGAGGGLGASSGDGPGSWLWLQAPPVGTALSDLAQLCIDAKPSNGI